MIKSTLQRWGSRIKEIISRMLNWVWHRSDGKQGSSTVKNSDESKKNGLDDDEFYDEYFKKLLKVEDITVRLGLYERLDAALKYVYEMGRRDGSLGIKLPNFAAIARANAQQVFRHVYVVLQGKLAALKAEFDAAETVKKNDDTLFKREQSYYDYVRYQYRFFPRSHSWFLFALYLVVAFALIVADLPLALMLIQNGFDISGSASLDEPFSYSFRTVFNENWQVILPTVGISLCTVYIKIYYDEFIGTPYANRLMIFKQFLFENGIENLHNSDEKKIKAEHSRKSAWKTGIFIITISTIFILALFRSEVAERIDGFKFTLLTQLAFIAITILFPLISGVCLSYSLTNLQNLVRLDAAGKTTRRLQKRWVKAVEAATIIEKSYKDMLAAELRLSDESGLVAEYESYLLASYERGYAIGGMQPQKYIQGEDFFTKIQEWRNTAISRKINNNINKLA